VAKSTIVLAIVCVGLCATLGLVAWQLVKYAQNPGVPLAGGSSFNLGLPDLKPEDDVSLVSAESALLYDINNGGILFEQNGFERRPIASITKLMTAMVALDHGIPWDQTADIQSEEYVQGGRLLLHPGEHVTMRDLFNASLLGSANNATLAYVRQLGMPKEEFVRRMNRKAIELGLEQTEFEDVTGLSPRNVSTAYEVAVIAKTAFSQYPEIAAATSQAEYKMVVGESGREHTIRNTNKLVSEWGDAASGSKTGYLYEAKYCLVMQGAGESADKIAVVLGSPSENSHFSEVKQLLEMPAR